MTTTLELELRGPGGEPVDLWRTIVSHGLASLPPMRVDEAARRLEVTMPVPRGRPRMVTIREGRPGHALVEIAGRTPPPALRSSLHEGVRHVLSLDRDLSGFYEVAGSDPDLAWATSGAGRMIRSPTVFEEVVKTVCTTNCSWGATVRMVSALVEHLGEPAAGAPPSGAYGRAFPTAEAMALAPEAFYKDVVRSGYRGRYLIELATRVAAGDVDLAQLGSAARDELSDQEMLTRLLALPGVGPYAAAHIMLMLGRHSLLILDSWTRPKYARLVGRKSVPDATIERRFRRYGAYAGLAFWLFLTRDWVEDDAV